MSADHLDCIIQFYNSIYALIHFTFTCSESYAKVSLLWGYIGAWNYTYELFNFFFVGILIPLITSPRLSQSPTVHGSGFSCIRNALCLYLHLQWKFHNQLMHSYTYMIFQCSAMCISGCLRLYIPCFDSFTENRTGINIESLKGKINDMLALHFGINDYVTFCLMPLRDKTMHIKRN